MTRRTLLWLATLALIFAFRLAYGLSMMFWTEDERQTYLVGLRSFAREEWPYFGADVVWTGTRLPGALQALLIRWPLELWPVPEAPVVLLNILSFGTLALLAWYVSRRVPDVPRGLVWGALLTLPWTLSFSTHVVNTSYILPGSVIFFVGFFEAMPLLAAGLVSPLLAWAMMGAGLLFLVQIHMSWVLLPPYAVVAAVDLARRDRRRLAAGLVAFAAGAAVPGTLLVPTLLEYGWAAGGVERTVVWQPQGPATLLTIVARFLSFPAFETNRFLGLDTAERLMVLWRHPWVLPIVGWVTLVGLVQPLAMAVAGLRSTDPSDDWTRVKWLTAATIGWIYVSFFFSVRGPLAHAFYVVFPVAVLYGACCWRVFAGVTIRGPAGRFFSRAWVERLSWGTLACGLVMHAVLAVDRTPRLSLYLDRPLVEAAIRAPNDRFLGDRRDSIVEVLDRRARPIDPVSSGAAYDAARARDDLVLLHATWEPLVGRRISAFAVAVHNVSDTAAYLDLRYTARYHARDGTLVATRDGVIKEVLQPGETRSWSSLVNGMVPAGAAAATFELGNAEKSVPGRS